MSGGVVKLYRRALNAERFRQRRSHSVPLGIRSPRRRSAPTESDKGAPPSAALSPTPQGLLSLSLRPGTNPGPRSIRKMVHLVKTCHPERKTNIAVSCILKSPLQRLFSYLLNQPVDLQLLLSFVHLFFLLGEFQLELHLLLVFSLLLQRVCVGSFLLFLLLFSFLGGQRLVKIKRNICHSEQHTARHAETASDSTQQTTLWIMNMKPRLCHDDIKTS